MNIQLATLAQASVLQLRDALRRVTSLHAAAARTDAEQQLADEFLAGMDAGDASWNDWEETSFDVRQFHG